MEEQIKWDELLNPNLTSKFAKYSKLSEQSSTANQSLNPAVELEL